MRPKTKRTSIILSAVSILAGTTILIPMSATAEDQNQSRGNAQTRQEDGRGPEVRFGNPAKTISSDSDQRDYDAQDGGISGVNVFGSRVFEVRPANVAAPKSGTTVLNLIKHQGNPMAVTKIYSIFWGSTFSQSSYSTDVNNFLTGISSAGYNAVTTQYMTGKVANAMSFTASFADSSNPPTSAPTTASILAEVYKVVVTNNKQSIDPQGLYMVFTNNFPAKAGYCAWHGAGSVSGSANFAIAYQPYLANQSGCSASYLAGYKAKTNVAVDSVANVASHEIYETVTDPLLNAWYDSAGAEIGDKCAWKTATTIYGYSVQTEWDNSISGCRA